MSRSDIEEIEISIEQARKAVDLGKAIERLLNNRDFKKVVMDDYFEKESARLVHALSEPAMQKPEQQAALIAEMQAIARFRRHLDFLVDRGRRMAADIADFEATREELQVEGLE